MNENKQIYDYERDEILERATASSLEKVRSLICSGCGMLHERVANLTGRAFGPGGLTICIGCQLPMRFPQEHGAQFFEMVDPKDLPIDAYREFLTLKDNIKRVRRKDPVQFDKAVATMRELARRKTQD